MPFTESRRVKRTAKLHRCCWCAEPIPVGSAVWRDTIADSQGLSSGHWHDECHAAASRMSRSDREDCYDGWDAGDFDRGLTPTETDAKRGGERMTPKPPKIGVTILTISRVDGCGIWRKLRPRNRSIDRLLKVLRYGVQRNYWLDWRIVLFDEAKR